MREGRPLKLILPLSLRAELLAHASGSPDREICGLLGGSACTATSLYRVSNTAASPEDSFFMAPQEQIRAMRTMRERGEKLLAIYHSHPHAAALPSARDLALAAYPGVGYLIVSLENPEVPAIGCFCFDGTMFHPLPLTAEG